MFVWKKSEIPATPERLEELAAFRRELMEILELPSTSSKLEAAAASLQGTPMQVALAWLLERSANIFLIPGTSSVQHLRENLKAATLQLRDEMVVGLDSISGGVRGRRIVSDSPHRRGKPLAAHTLRFQSGLQLSG